MRERRCAKTLVTRLQQEKNIYLKAYSHVEKLSLMRRIPSPLVPADPPKNWPSLFGRCSVYVSYKWLPPGGSSLLENPGSLYR